VTEIAQKKTWKLKGQWASPDEESTLKLVHGSDIVRYLASASVSLTLEISGRLRSRKHLRPDIDVQKTGFRPLVPGSFPILPGLCDKLDDSEPSVQGPLNQLRPRGTILQHCSGNLLPYLTLGQQ
jgi:hypothetical protein